MKVGTSAKRLARMDVAALGDVMRQHDGELKAPLQRSKVTQNGRDVPGVVLVSCVQADERVVHSTLVFHRP
jgi:hypothetical protein